MVAITETHGGVRISRVRTTRALVSMHVVMPRSNVHPGGGLGSASAADVDDANVARTSATTNASQRVIPSRPYRPIVEWAIGGAAGRAPVEVRCSTWTRP